MDTRPWSLVAGIRAAALAAMLVACLSLVPAAAADSGDSLLDRADATLAQDADAARALAQQALTAAEQTRDTAVQARALLFLGRADLQQGKLSAAIVPFERALQLDAVPPPLRARLLSHLGVTLDRSGLSVDAIAPQQDALQLYLEQRNWQDASAVLANLGNAYMGQGDAQAARAHYERALALKREHGLARGIGSVLNNLADFAMESGRFADAEMLLREALAASLGADDAGARCTALTNLALALAELNRHDEALQAADEAATLAATLHDPSRALGAVRARAQTILRRAQAAKQGGSERALSLRDAADSVRPAIEQARTAGDPPRQLQLLELLADIREAQGDTGSALTLLREANALRDATEARRQNERRATASARFEYAKQRGELALLRERAAAGNEQLRNQRWLVLALAIAVLGVTAAALAALHRMRERHQFDATLEQRNRDLAAALDEANAERRRSDAYAASHRHLLHLASEDLREPLNDIRSDAERLLVDPGTPEQQHRRSASIARAAADLIWVTDQMLESAREPDFAAPLQPRAPTPLRPILRDIVDEASVHALRHQKELVLDAPSDIDAAVDPQRLRSVLHELIELVLRASPTHVRCTVRLRGDAGVARILVDDIGGAASGWQHGMESGTHERSRVPRLGFAWIAQTVLTLGGDIGTALHGTPPVRVVALLLPRTPGVRLAPEPGQD